MWLGNVQKKYLKTAPVHMHMYLCNSDGAGPALRRRLPAVDVAVGPVDRIRLLQALLPAPVRHGVLPEARHAGILNIANIS